MSLIVAQHVSKSWSEKDVLKNVCATLAPCDRVGLVGPNGHGKTTLLRILAGLEPPTEGLVQRKTGLRVGFLPQDPPTIEGATLRGALLAVFADLRRMEEELHDLARRLQAGDERLLARYGELQHVFEARGGYSFSRRVEQVLSGLHFPRDLWDQPLERLSGGQRTRAYLGRLLLEEPDVLLLDEPTNHLDLEATEWLEEWLSAFAGAAVVVSHDRYFLDRATQRTWEVSFARLECYRGAYTHYLTQREERFTERLRQWEAQQQHVEETLDFIRRFGAGQRSQEAQGRKTRLERFLRTEAIERPREHPRITVRLRAGARTGDFVWRAQDLRVGYDPARPLLTTERLSVQRGDRVAIVGPNGCGKTTLLRTILGQLPPLGGTVKPGAGASLGYLSQIHAELPEEATALECLRQIEPSLPEERARSLLGGLLLSGDDAFKRIRQLSGGQRSRVALARLVLQSASVLLLDEPTNHLDIPSQEVLQDVLSDFDGTVIFVSHDRYLIRALATHIWAAEGGAITPLPGDWEKYVQWREDRPTAGADAHGADRCGAGAAAGRAGGTASGAGAAGRAHAARAKEGRKEEHKDRRRRTNELLAMKRRLAKVEKQIHELETRRGEVHDAIGRAGEAGDVEEVTRLGLEYEEVDARLRGLLAEWETLGAAVEGG